MKSEEISDEGIARSRRDLLRGADLLDRTLVDDDDAVGDLKGLLLIVGDKEAGEVGFLMKLSEPSAQFPTDFRIEGSEGFVEQEDARFHGEGTCKGDTLSLTS